MKVIINCYIVKSILELFIKNQINLWIMPLTVKSIHELFILIIKLIPNSIESQLIFIKESSKVFVSRYEWRIGFMWLCYYVYEG